MLRLAAAVAPAAIRALGSTLRIEVRGGERLERVRASGRPFLYVVWHGRILLPILHHRDEQVLAMVSLSRDGDFTARVLSGLGYRTVRGSSSRGGNEAFHAMVAELKPGRAGAIIPDGPRGPSTCLKPGILYLAHQAGAYILPLSSSAHPARSLRSWDRFVLPMPFARGVVNYGEPVAPPEDCSTQRIEQMRQDLERCLKLLQAEADHCLGRPEAGDASAEVGAPP